MSLLEQLGIHVLYSFYSTPRIKQYKYYNNIMKKNKNNNNNK